MISAIIITKNEERSIERCIKSLAFTDEVIVVDDHSTDTTAKKATALGAHVITSTWSGFGSQKNIGLKQAKNDWVLFIDADEVVSPELAKSIQSTVSAPTHNVYWLPVLDIFLGRPLHHLTGNNPRLFRRDKAQWTERRVHEQVRLKEDGTIVSLRDTHSDVLDGYLIHYTYTRIRDYLHKMHRYTTLDAEQMAESNTHRSGRKVRSSFFLPFQLAARQFIKLAFWRRGLLDGYAGFIWCCLSSYYEFEMGRKFIKLTKS